MILILVLSIIFISGCGNELPSPQKETKNAPKIQSDKVTHLSPVTDKQKPKQPEPNQDHSIDKKKEYHQKALTTETVTEWEQKETQSNTTTSHQAQTASYQIEINKQTNQLFLYQDGQVIRTFPVATGRDPSRTPEGTFPIIVKFVKPGWKNIPGGVPENPLGPRWNGLQVNGDSGRTYGIHGTNNPDSIGNYASNGCVRMYNQDVIELYSLIPIGTPVWIHSGESNGVWRGNQWGHQV
ncbi:hypothetical protein DL897_04340 [Thermoflavimicrobium daqui]|uniref:L,D-TPase catalytic domain-containing protein n=2 Tax=Thermoflavimicrobium daqui TaxID=2137476 RepID=A0A364K846_9BACL|nr:hypothetical protein DL897_04340 [Thermoflavimicrobium daqui]